MEMHRDKICGIVNDLLAQYVEGSLGEDGTWLVEEHLKECGGCRQTYEAMKEKLPVQPYRATERDMEVMQAFKKARRGMWKRILAGFLAGVLVVSLGIFAWRLQHGEGALPLNAKERRETKEVMRTWLEEGASKAVARMDPAVLYRQMITPSTEVPWLDVKLMDDGGARSYDIPVEEFPLDRLLYFDIGGEQYLMGNSVECSGDALMTCRYAGGSQGISMPKAGAPLREVTDFWYEVMTDSEYSYLVPEHIYQEVIDANSSLDTENVCYTDNPGGENPVGYPVDCEIKSIDIGGKTYYYRESPSEHVSGRRYMYDSISGGVLQHFADEPLPEWYTLVKNTDILPREVFHLYYQEEKKLAGWCRDRTAYYEQMGEEEFASQWRERLSDSLAQLEREGVTLTDYAYVNCQRISDSSSVSVAGGPVVYENIRWEVIYRVTFSNGYTGMAWLSDSDGKVYLSGISGRERYDGSDVSYLLSSLLGDEEIPKAKAEFFDRIVDMLQNAREPAGDRQNGEDKSDENTSENQEKSG